MLSRNRLAFSLLALAAAFRVASPTSAGDVENAQIAARLRAAYPDYVTGTDGDCVSFRDGTSLPLGDGKTEPFEAWLARPDIKDMFRYTYPRGARASQPAENFDPGRARNEAFFTKLYGDCRKPGFASSLTSIPWLPRKSGQRISISRRNGVADHLREVSAELDRLPQSFDVYLIPSAGGYMCRNIAGTRQLSGHGYGIAIDIAVGHSHYWRWAKGASDKVAPYRNEIPPEIVEIFEKHGFIWGGRWYHYDTMHFEYRPELLQSGG
jgi:hypothetical protein